MSAVDQNTNPTHSMTKDAAEEIKIPVPWGHLSGKWWGPMDQQPIVALHGWQDNAGTFEHLIPLLPADIAILCVDLPSHGLSSHLHEGQYYCAYWEPLFALRRIQKYYKWNKLFSGNTGVKTDTHAWNDNAVALPSLILSSYNYCLPIGKWWGPKNVQPIVALHGRQDNAGSFDTLIPLLPGDISVLCLDMPGHGLSSHYPKSQYYYAFWDGVILLRRIVKHFKWSKMKLLGHSLGGAVAFLYAASYPESTEFVIALDMAGPTIGRVTKHVPVTGSYIDKFLEYEALKSENAPTYTYEDVIQIANNGYNGAVSKEGIVTLMKRGALPSYQPDQYYFARDPRLKVAYLGMLSMDLILEYAAQIKCAYLNIRATKGYISDEPDNYQATLDVIKKSARRFEYHEVEGNHFVHLNNPERVAPIIIKFLRT